MMASSACIAGIAGVAFGALLIESMRRQQLPLDDVSTFLFEAVVMTLALPALLCLTQQHLVSSKWSYTSKKCISEDGEIAQCHIKAKQDFSKDENIFCDVIAESNMYGVVKMNDMVCSQEHDGKTSSKSPAGKLLSHLHETPNSAHGHASHAPPIPYQCNLESEESICPIPSVDNAGHVTSAGQASMSEELTVREEPKFCDFHVDPFAARMMHTGPSHFLLQVFKEAAAANGVQENYQRVQQGPSPLLTQALMQTMVSHQLEDGKKEFIEASPKSTTASSEDMAAEEKIPNLDIDPEYENEEFEDENADDHEDEYRALLRDFGVPSDQGEDDEEDDDRTDEDASKGYDRKHDEDDAVDANQRAILRDLGVLSDAGEKGQDLEEEQEEDDEEEDEDAEDAQYRAFLEELGVPSNWNEHRDDEEEEWLTEDEEEV